VNKPQVFNALLFSSSDTQSMGSVETPVIMRLLRPATLGLWLIVFVTEVQTVVSTGEHTNWLLLMLSTAVFVAAHIQFWYEESEQGSRFHNLVERMRGRIYEDEATSLPNSRHFVFELRRQMMRSVRSGRGFSLVLTDISGFDRIPSGAEKTIPAMSRALGQAIGSGDFLARLQGPIFSAILLDEKDCSAGEKAEAALVVLGACIPLDLAGTVYPVVSLTGFQGEIEVRDFLRRAQRDLVANRSRDITATLRHKPQRARIPA
jgi:GGDEF domain-containing protein